MFITYFGIVLHTAIIYKLHTGLNQDTDSTHKRFLRQTPRFECALHLLYHHLKFTCKEKESDQSINIGFFPSNLALNLTPAELLYLLFLFFFKVDPFLTSQQFCQLNLEFMQRPWKVFLVHLKQLGQLQWISHSFLMTSVEKELFWLFFIFTCSNGLLGIHLMYLMLKYKYNFLVLLSTQYHGGSPSVSNF